MPDGEDALLDFVELENDFFEEGYDLGLQDGRIAGRVEGKIFGIEKGFEKALEMGRLHGRAKLWNSRFPTEPETASSAAFAVREEKDIKDFPEWKIWVGEGVQDLRPIPANVRLAKHVETLLAMTEPQEISKENADDAVAEFDERIKRALAKTRIITHIIGEPGSLRDHSKKHQDPNHGDGSGNIEDLSSLSARH